MNQEQLISLVRQLLLTIGGGLVTKGYIDGGSWSIIAGGLATIIVTGGWALYTRRNAGLVQSASNVPVVAQIKVTDPAIASPAVTNDKVTL